MNTPEFKEPPPKIIASILWLVLFFLVAGILIPKLLALVVIVFSLGATVVAIALLFEYYLE